MRHQSSFQIIDDHPSTWDAAQNNRDQPQTAEESQRLVIAKESQDCPKNKYSILHHLDLGMTTCGALFQIDGNLHDRKAALERLNRHFRFGFKSATEKRKTTDETSTEHSITRKQVGQTHPENSVEEEPK